MSDYLDALPKSLNGLSLRKRYAMYGVAPLWKWGSRHHELCEVAAGRILGYWSEDLCDCGLKPVLDSTHRLVP